MFFLLPSQVVSTTLLRLLLCRLSMHSPGTLRSALLAPWNLLPSSQQATRNGPFFELLSFSTEFSLISGNSAYHWSVSMVIRSNREQALVFLSLTHSHPPHSKLNKCVLDGFQLLKPIECSTLVCPHSMRPLSEVT